MFHDKETEFTLDYDNMLKSLNTSLEELGKKYANSIELVHQEIDDLESGKIVNKTDHLTESENRSVDHYNLRLEEEKVEGKSLACSIKQWNMINEQMNEILTRMNVTDVIFNGIGGSFLGPLLLITTIKGLDYNYKSDRPFIHFISNTDSDSFTALMKKVNLKTTIMINMSKSGGTAETKGNMEAFNDILKLNELSIGVHNIAITTKDSNFDVYAHKNKFLSVFYMNNDTGGRTSICSAIGMVPSAVAGLNFEEFLKGQCYMDKLTREKEIEKNPALIISLLIEETTKRFGRKNMIVLGYSDYLKEFAHYLQQLYMESLGKEYTRDGRIHPEGLTVFGGVGTGEQHAFMQQVQKGIPDCIVRFVHFLKRGKDFGNVLSGTMGRQLLAFVKGTEEALIVNKKPFITSTFLERNLFSLGMMIALEERIVSILASFRNINAYDQPGVQDGKLAAQEMNKLSIEIEQTILNVLPFEGSASALIKLLHLNGKSRNVDAVLSDMYANPQSYTVRTIIDRSVKDGHFHYIIRSQL